MTRRTVLLVVAASLAVGAAVAAPPEEPQSASGGWGFGSSCAHAYDLAAVVTVRGEVMAVESVVPHAGVSPGRRLVLKTATETITVSLGPEWFLERQEAGIETGDAVEVTGSRVVRRGKPTLLAARVTRGERILHLRDDSGVPVWDAWRPRR
jgi:DNA/RNA endonuclease YhcR with UshA esterase domain